jgi:ribosomal protein L11 methylase PrmA
MTAKRISTEPPWSSREPVAGELILRGRTRTELWGFGQHPSTSLCLSILVGLYGEHGPRPDRVVEFSCGSALLCIAASKLGALRVTGVEPDLELQAIAAENAQGNGARLELVADATDLVGVPTTLTIANLSAQELQTHAGLLAKLAAHGHLLIAGFVEEEREQTEQLFLQRNSRFLYRETREGLIATVFKSRTADTHGAA